MSQRVLSLEIGLVALTLLACAQQPVSLPEKTVSTEADVEAIKALLERNASLISSEDLDGWIAQFTEDAIFMPSDVAVLTGQEAGRELARPWLEQFDVEFDISVDQVEVVGTWAFARWSFTSRATPLSGGETIERNGKEIWIFRGQSDGSWRCSHIIYNYDSPLPPPDSAEE